MDYVLLILVPLSVIMNSLVIAVGLSSIIRRRVGYANWSGGSGGSSGVNLRSVLILSLAVSDIIASGFGFALELLMSVIGHNITAMCTIAGMTVSACALVSMVHLGMLSLEVRVIGLRT